MGESFTLFSFMSLLFLSSMFPILTISAFNSTHLPLCHDDERSALFQFKESFIIDEDASFGDPSTYSKVESWKLNGDCCSWDGVECDRLTGHVIGLDLSRSGLYGSINSSSSLFRLVHLRKLNLAFNHFNYSQIPHDVGLLSNLVSVSMSNSFLSGPIPSNFSDLSNLTSLDLSLNDQLSFQASDFKHLVSKLIRHLEVLSLSYVEISSTVPAILANASSLSTLILNNCGLYGEFPVEIFHLSKLEVLILSRNQNLKGHLPDFHSTSPLRILRLAYTSFSGEIPGSIGNLDSLIELNFIDCNFSGEIPGSLENLTKLSYLYLSENPFNRQNISSFSWLAKLTKLVGLSFENANLYGEFPSWCENLTQLSYLSLGLNQLTGPFPTSVVNLTDLTTLILYGNRLQGSIPSSISQLRNLEVLYLSDNSFSGEIPGSLGNLTKLSYLYFSNNVFDRQSISSLSWVSRLTNLVKLSFDETNLYGDFPSGWFANLTQLSYLSLRLNQLTGPFPTSLVNLTNLTVLDLYGNRLERSIPKSISQLRNLVHLNLQHNRFTGTLEFDIFLKFEKLQRIFLSRNNLKLVINTSSNNTFQQFLGIGFGDCKLDVFPDFLRYQDKLEYLGLSNNNIAGRIPKWLWNMSTDTLQYIDFSSNFLTGFEAQPNPIVLPWAKATFIYLRDNMLQSSLPLPPVSIENYLVGVNKLTGEIPPSFCNLSSLNALAMENNQLSGRLPSCLGNFSTNMEMLNLGGNGLYGEIPLAFSSGSNLRMIQLYSNQLQGKLPRSLSNCTMLEFLDIGNNQIRDVFPSWLGVLSNLKVLILSSNQFHGVLTAPTTILEFQKLRIIDLSINNFTGQLPAQYFFKWVAMKVVDENKLAYIDHNRPDGKGYTITIFFGMLITSKGTERRYNRILDNFVVVDLSCNRFEGEIPEVIGSLQGLHQLNLSHNHLNGGIPSILANLTRLESLDLSQNKLSGAIPQQLAQLNSLAVFDVSHNLLAGPIPQGKQFNTFQNDSYRENLELCGNPLSRKCGNSEAPPRLSPSLEDEDNSLLEFGWESVAIGYASGLVFGLAIGYIVVTKYFDWFARFFRVRVKRTRRARNRRVRN